MKEYQSLTHTRWDCKYHVVFIPKMRKKKIFGVLRQHLGAIFRELAKHKEVEVVEGHLMSDHVHICLSIPPKYAVSNVVGYIKGKKVALDADRSGLFHNLPGSKLLLKLDCGNVQGFLQRIAQSYRPPEFLIVILGFPYLLSRFVELHGGIHDQMRREKTMVDSG